MEGKSVFHSIAILCLALSIVIGSWFIAKGLSAQKTFNVSTQEQLLTQQQTAAYLGLSEKNVGELISTPDHEIENEIPHFQLGNKLF